jgi:hypothetical protein
MMKKRQILWAIVFGSMLAVTGCGDDETGGNGTGATGGGGTGATGGGGTGATGGGGNNPSSTCEAFCGGLCDIEDIAPGEDFDACVSGCAGFFEDQCGSQAQALVACYESTGCDENAVDAECQSEAIAWAQCIGGFSF